VSYLGCGCTPLPELITLQGIKGPGPEQVFVGLSPRLGIQLRRRNVLVAMAAVLLCVSSVAAYRWTLRPWSLNGIVREIPSEDPLAGVVVEATTANGKNYSLRLTAMDAIPFPYRLRRPNPSRYSFGKTATTQSIC